MTGTAVVLSLSLVVAVLPPSLLPDTTDRLRFERLDFLPDGVADPPSASESSRLDEVIERMGAKDRARRYQAAIDAGPLATARHLPKLHELLLNHRNARVRGGVADQLHRIGSRKSATALVEAMRADESMRVRCTAARALGRIGDSATRQPLFDTLTGDTEPRVRKHAAVALGSFPGPRPAVALERALEAESDDDVEIVIRQTLTRRGLPWMKPAEIRPGHVTEGVFEGTRYLIYVPYNYRSRPVAGLLVSVHGTHGSPRGYVDMCRKDANRYNVVVLGPHFDYGTFPDFGNLNPWYGWTRADLRLLEIIDDLVSRSSLRPEPFAIFGHSQGGQFVHRFVLAHPDRVARAAACAGGNYVHPEPDSVFPWGTKRNPLAPDLSGLDFVAPRAPRSPSLSAPKTSSAD